ncbi:MAG TPA: hypothetical protein VK477_14565 [Acidobacteriota bacterium]|nr:hypothetical protein [Acidobacteriota bacterium]
MTTAPLPYSVILFVNKRTGSTSWRVTGTGNKNGRVRKNFGASKGGEEAARHECDRLNADELAAPAQQPLMRAVATRLTVDQLTAVDAALQRAKGRWLLVDILDAGLEALHARGPAVEIEPLFREWEKGAAEELKDRWRADVRKTTERFLADNPGLTSRSWTPGVTRKWLDSLDVEGQTKANYRSALHRFGQWLCERLDLTDNPAGGLLITRRKQLAEQLAPPSVLSPLQIEALLVAHLGDEQCRRQLGWFVECAFAGLRPMNEAPHAVWKEIDLAAAEQAVLGYKRGIKPRTLTLQPTTVAWLREYKKIHAKLEPGAKLAPYSTPLRRAAVMLANVWLAKHHPGTPPIVWDEDILRHTYASMRAAEGVTMDALAAEMGTSVKVIYAHYRHTRPAREAKAFWALTPERIRAIVRG